MPIDPNSILTGGEPEPLEGRISALLDEVGLELWQAPEGFWAIRAKRAAMPTQPAPRSRKRHLEGRA
jgi:hypothetical protein